MFGALLSLIEGVSFADGFLFVAGILSSAIDPLTPWVPTFLPGKILCSYAASCSLGLFALALGLVGENLLFPFWKRLSWMNDSLKIGAVVRRLSLFIFLGFFFCRW